MPAHNWLTEPDLLFHPDLPDHRHIHPLIGLEQFGPYSQSVISQVLDPIRIGFIVAHGHTAPAKRLLAELEQRHQPRERQSYLIDFPGFSRLFHVRAAAARKGCHVELGPEIDEQLANSSDPHLVLAEGLTRALSNLDAYRNEIDVLVLILPERWKHCFKGRPDEDFDLHDYLKAVTASRSVPLQILQEESAFTYRCRCSVMWRLSIALYCKAGGVPWKLADTDPDTAFVGLSYAHRDPNASRPQFVTCCSQVFDADGAGLEFIAYNTDGAHIERDNPYLSRAEMRRVMARSLVLYQRRHAGRNPNRVVVHKSTPFKPEEIDGCFDAWPIGQGLELVQIQQESPWRAVQIDPPRRRGEKGMPSRYPCRRGSFLQLGGRDVLLWTQGNVPMARNVDFYKEGKGIPAPLVISRFAGHGSFDQLCRDILGLSKMNWNNDGLYDRLPVTMSYASILARTVKRMPRLQSRPYQFRFMM
jgi:hypothetical protein